MPRLRDIPIAFRKVGPRQLFRRVYSQVVEDDVLVWASSLAYSWLFSVFPLLIFLLTLLPYAPAEQRQQVINSITDSVKQLPADTAKQLQEWVNYALNESDRYVWVYSERLRWWDGTPPKEYVEALALAKKGPATQEAVAPAPSK
jgi:uncharacterized BrkB/YihY/UPF0761 family membrane protein